jgi:hypothetical protein
MAADYTTVKKRITETLRACIDGTFVTVIDPANFTRNADAIVEAAREGAMLVAKAIVANANHVHRGLFMSASPTSLTHGAELPDMAGEACLIEIKPYSAGSFKTGILKPVSTIDAFRENVSSVYDAIAHDTSGSTLGGYYAVANGRVYFTGYAAQAYFPTIDRSTVTGLIPDEYEGVWTALGIGMAAKKDTGTEAIASYYMNYGLSELEAIKQMSITRPMPTPEQMIAAKR